MSGSKTTVSVLLIARESASPQARMNASLPYKEVKCPRCSWVHASVPMSMVEADSSEELERYFRCFQCGAPTSSFVAAGPEDAPQGCSLQPVVVGALPQHNKCDSFRRCPRHDMDMRSLRADD